MADIKAFWKNILCRVHSKLLRPSNIIDNCFNLVYLNATLTREPKRCLAYQNSNVVMKRLKKNNGFTWTALISRQLSFQLFFIVFTPLRDGKIMINLYNVKKLLIVYRIDMMFRKKRCGCILQVVNLIITIVEIGLYLW